MDNQSNTNLVAYRIFHRVNLVARKFRHEVVAVRQLLGLHKRPVDAYHPEFLFPPLGHLSLLLFPLKIQTFPLKGRLILVSGQIFHG